MQMVLGTISTAGAHLKYSPRCLKVPYHLFHSCFVGVTFLFCFLHDYYAVYLLIFLSESILDALEEYLIESRCKRMVDKDYVDNVKNPSVVLALRGNTVDLLTDG